MNVVSIINYVWETLGAPWGPMRVPCKCSNPRFLVYPRSQATLDQSSHIALNMRFNCIFDGLKPTPCVVATHELLWAPCWLVGGLLVASTTPSPPKFTYFWFETCCLTFVRISQNSWDLFKFYCTTRWGVPSACKGHPILCPACLWAKLLANHRCILPRFLPFFDYFNSPR